MKNLIVTAAIAIATIFTVNAQNSAIILGINGGTNFSKMDFTGDFAIQDEKTSRKMGFQGGVDLGVKFGNFAFITGFKYNQRGGNTSLRKSDPNDPFILNDGTLDVGEQTTTTRFSNLSIPLLVRYQTQGDLAFSVSLGPVINKGLGEINTETSYTLTNSGNIGPIENTFTYGDLGDDLFKSSGMGFMFSPGVLYKVGDNGVFRANLTYNSGGNVVNKNLVVPDGFGGLRNVSGSIKSSSLVLEIGYEHRIDFNIGSKY
ncbi:MAG: outer membrane beta-barrel protein [Saprospiraceae bacterium]|nr:outer membrane beta-barrel protein [Saprospiraceae bacterium]